MLIEIRNVGFTNKGAELMLYAILDRIRFFYPQAKFVMVPTNNTPYHKRAQLAFLQKVSFRRFGIQFGDIMTFFPQKGRERLGLVLDNEISVVLDASGFCYGDQWGDKNSIELAAACTQWKKNKTKVYLLPQAFGPFTSIKIKKSIKIVVSKTNLIFVRDQLSYDHLIEVVGEQKNIRLAPDFTNLLSGVLPIDFDIITNRFCIVPNIRMIDKALPEERELYLPFLIKCIKYLLEKKQNPFLLIHDSVDDLIIATKIQHILGPNLQIVKESNPLHVKGIIGSSSGLLGSRFHSLVSALSQGVPSLGTGWSHKYQMLFNDYEFPYGLLSVKDPDQDIYNKIDFIIDPVSIIKIKKQLNYSSNHFKMKSEKMWRDIINDIGKNHFA